MNNCLPPNLPSLFSRSSRWQDTTMTDGHSVESFMSIQPKREPHSSERSDAYIRAITLSLNQSVPIDEDPTTPPAPT